MIWFDNVTIHSMTYSLHIHGHLWVSVCRPIRCYFHASWNIHWRTATLDMMQCWGRWCILTWGIGDFKESGTLQQTHPKPTLTHLITDIENILINMRVNEQLRFLVLDSQIVQKSEKDQPTWCTNPARQFIRKIWEFSFSHPYKKFKLFYCK